MKKTLIIAVIITTVATALFVACKKETYKAETNSPNTGIEQKTNTASNNPTLMMSGPVFGVRVNLQLNRNAKHERRKHRGQSCNCVYCFGICSARAFDDDDNSDESELLVNGIIESNDNSQATLYILSKPDEDVDVDPVLYVDDDVNIQNSSTKLIIHAGNYAYDQNPGHVVFNGKDYAYYGRVIVNYSNLQ